MGEDLVKRAEGEKAFLVGVESARFGEVALDELAALTESAGGAVVGQTTQKRRAPDPGTYIGRGKMEEVAAEAEEAGANLVIFDNDLSPGQLKNLEKGMGRRVIDRSELILDIFASRARTDQARLQVELAQLEYSLPRLRRMWSHLSRIEGGIGTRGPGEKQLETDRRLVKGRISDLRQRLRRIAERREREVAGRSGVFTTALVGYTNVGKSTLLNFLTRGGAETANRLFMTLDTRTRSWAVGNNIRVLLSDTVGFIRSLPHHLVSSFHATLEEARQADLLLHVIDATHPEVDRHVAAVHRVLADLGVTDRPCINVLNKIDLLEDPPGIVALSSRFAETVSVSARTGQGIEDLERLVREKVLAGYVAWDVEVSAQDGRLRAFLCEHAVTERSEELEDGGVRLRVLLSRKDLGQAKSIASTGT